VAVLLVSEQCCRQWLSQQASHSASSMATMSRAELSQTVGYGASRLGRGSGAACSGAAPRGEAWVAGDEVVHRRPLISEIASAAAGDQALGAGLPSALHWLQPHIKPGSS
jgi:hypothetical protein